MSHRIGAILKCNMSIFAHAPLQEFGVTLIKNRKKAFHRCHGRKIFEF